MTKLICAYDALTQSGTIPPTNHRGNSLLIWGFIIFFALFFKWNFNYIGIPKQYVVYFYLFLSIVKMVSYCMQS